MNTGTRDSETSSVTVWTPWGSLDLAKDDSRHSKLGKRLDTRRQRKVGRTALAKQANKDASRN